MKIKSTKTDSANAKIEATISNAKIESKIQQVAQKIAKNAKISGFRSGKVPTNVILTRYKDQIEQDAHKELIQDLLDSALKELNIEVKSLIGDPLINKFDKSDNQIAVEMQVSTLPEFNVDGIEKHIPTPDIPQVDEKVLDSRLDAVREARAELVESKDKEIKKDHVANIDFEGFVNGVAFDGGKGSNFDLHIGGGQFIPGFEDGLIGAKLNDEVEIKITFPKDYPSKDLAGKEATFKVKVNSIKDRIKSKLDDEFARKILGEEANIEKLKEQVRLEIENEFKSAHYDELKEKCLEALYSSINFDLPKVIVEREMDIQFRNSLAGLTEEEIKELQSNPQKAKERRESFRENAEKSVKITFIIDAIAKQRGIDISDNEVMSTIYYEALMNGQNPKDTLDYYKNQNLLPAVKMAMVENRVLHSLLDEKSGVSKTESKKESKTTSSKTAPKTNAKAESKTTKPRATKTKES